MCCVKLISLFAALSGLIGAGLLLYLALRVSNLLRDAWKVKQTSTEDSADLDNLLSQAFKNNANTWSPRRHYMLVAGVIFSILSAALTVWGSLCGLQT